MEVSHPITFALHILSALKDVGHKTTFGQGLKKRKYSFHSLVVQDMFYLHKDT